MVFAIGVISGKFTSRSGRMDERNGIWTSKVNFSEGGQYTNYPGNKG